MAWYPGATTYELQPESDGQRYAGLPGAMMLPTRSGGSQEFGAVPEATVSLVARGAQQGAYTSTAGLGGVGTAEAITVDGKGPAIAARPLAYRARTPLCGRRFRVAPARHPVQRPALRVPCTVATVALKAIRCTGESTEPSDVEPDKARAALLFTTLVPVGRLGLASVRQCRQLASHVALPVVAGAQSLAHVRPCAAGELAPAGFPRRAGVHAVSGSRARITLTLPAAAVHSAPPAGAHAHRAVTSVDCAAGHVQAGVRSRKRKEAP
jgi:hypothetical protein